MSLPSPRIPPLNDTQYWTFENDVRLLVFNSGGGISIQPSYCSLSRDFTMIGCHVLPPGLSKSLIQLLCYSVPLLYGWFGAN